MSGDPSYTLKTIDYQAFSNCSCLKTIRLPDGLEALGASCFQNSGLVDIALPSSVRDVGACAFLDCKRLQSALLNEGLQTLGAETRVDGERLHG